MLQPGTGHAGRCGMAGGIVIGAVVDGVVGNEYPHSDMVLVNAE